MLPEGVLDLVARGDLAGLERLAQSGALAGLSGDDKNALTRQAALAGQAAALRGLFERHHLYATDPDARGRTLLHCAAESGDADTVSFCMDVLGYDPLSGDREGVTALELAGRAPRRAAADWLTERLGFGLSECYRNPVLRGCHPDPSIVRVGEDYYMVNSSFTLFPGLPVSHSRDLVHWEEIGHAAEDLTASGLHGLPGGYGCWAPDISYSGGRFWVVATLRRDTPPVRLQMITSAADPRGPWDAPRFLPLDGIDPSLFTDDDGQRYLLLNPGAMIARIDAEGRLQSEPEMIRFGSARVKPEGPHLLKKDGWYYLFLAEGGTGAGHMETVARSRSLYGPYEDCPFNPILGRKSPDAPIQRSGHGKPVQLPNGRWAMVYLCARPVEGRTLMGRETALDPLEWTADGWPMVNRLKGPSCLQRRPLPDAPADPREAWVSPRTDPRSFSSAGSGPTAGGGRIRLRCGADPATTGACSVLLRRQKEARFTQSALVDMDAAAVGALAGLTGYYDERSFYLFGLRRAADGCRAELVTQTGERREQITLAALSTTAARLTVTGDGLTRRLAVDGREVGSGRTEYLCDEGLTGGKRFTGAMLGLAAVGDGEATFTDYQEVWT